jgi:hypothetical protein
LRARPGRARPRGEEPWGTDPAGSGGLDTSSGGEPLARARAGTGPAGSAGCRRRAQAPRERPTTDPPGSAGSSTSDGGGLSPPVWGTDPTILRGHGDLQTHAIDSRRALDRSPLSRGRPDCVRRARCAARREQPHRVRGREGGRPPVLAARARRHPGLRPELELPGAAHGDLPRGRYRELRLPRLRRHGQLVGGKKTIATKTARIRCRFPGTVELKTSQLVNGGSRLQITVRHTGAAVVDAAIRTTRSQVTYRTKFCKKVALLKGSTA